jgi:hypothetical protein
MERKYAMPPFLKTRLTIELSRPDTTYYRLSDSFYLIYCSTYKGHYWDRYTLFRLSTNPPVPQVNNMTRKQRSRGVWVSTALYENVVRNLGLYLNRYRTEAAKFTFGEDSTHRMLDVIWMASDKMVWNRRNSGLGEALDTNTVVVDFLRLKILRKNWQPVLIQNGALELTASQFETVRHSYTGSKMVLEDVLEGKTQNQLVLASSFGVNETGIAVLESYDVFDNFAPVSYGYRFIGKTPNPEHSAWHFRLDQFQEVDSPNVALHPFLPDTYHGK